MRPVITSTPLIYALENVLFYKYIAVVILFFAYTLYIIICIMTYFMRYALIITYIHTFIMVTFDTGTNFPAVSWNPLLAVAMTNIRLR